MSVLLLRIYEVRNKLLHEKRLKVLGWVESVLFKDPRLIFLVFVFQPE